MFSQIDKQILKSWRQYAVEPRLARLTGRILRNTGPRIAVLGNCQAFGLAYAMKVMDPSATVDHFSAIGRSRVATMDMLVKTLDTYDYVFTHDFLEGHLRGGGDSEELLRRLPGKATKTPAVTFAAFHPDLIYIQDKSEPLHGFIFGPLGPYHSAIALFCYRAGLSLEETRAAFNENVFQTLGYLDMWNEVATGFIENARLYGVDLSTDLMNWSRRGVFMYSIVHPKSFVLFDIARRMLEKVDANPHREREFRRLRNSRSGARRDFPGLSGGRQGLRRAGRLSVQIAEPPSRPFGGRLPDAPAISRIVLQDFREDGRGASRQSARRRLARQREHEEFRDQARA
ncbi:WcbI family polysaccharide biosynthesis putative acetyltransferase [Methylocystis parvus]|uniref:WcbI family polysaccharide biosynthesis putative acetyltransferase n=1 Tax=Methylocystis parvus TaxID=134 RepID=UPI003C742969